MFQLVLVVCLVAGSPGGCREERTAYENLTAITCLTQGQDLAVRWVTSRPNLTLTGWRCEPPRLRQVQI